MPELPEVEEARRAVQESCAGKRILRALVLEDAKVLDGVTAAALQAALEGRVVVTAKRKGKNLWLELDQRPWPTFHFGMAGEMLIQGAQQVHYKRALVKEEDEWPPKYHKVVLELEGGVNLAFVDFRRFARIRLQQNPVGEPPISELGPDAHLELPSLEDFGRSLKLRKGSLKASLLDQTFLSGIGNWVADEVLFQAQLHPEQPGSSMEDEHLARLHESIKQVLELAVSLGADSKRFPADWLFHFRWDKKPGSVKGHAIEFITVGGRTSAFVPALQKVVGNAPKAMRKREVAASTIKTVKKKRGTGEDIGRDGAVEAEDVKTTRKQRRVRGETKEPGTVEDAKTTKTVTLKKEALKHKTKGAAVEQKEEETVVKIVSKRGRKTAKVTKVAKAEMVTLIEGKTDGASKKAGRGRPRRVVEEPAKISSASPRLRKQKVKDEEVAVAPAREAKGTRKKGQVH